MNYITAIEGEILNLGHQGDNKATTVRFPIEKWEEKYGIGSFSLFNKRTIDPDSYPCSIRTDSRYVYWNVLNSDTQYNGNGKCQLVYTVDDIVAKSVIYKTYVQPSLSVSEDPPVAWQGWVDKIASDINNVKLNNFKLQKIKDYLYYIEFIDWDYKDGERYFANAFPYIGGCSVVRNGDFYGRNFDWFYNDNAEFVIRTKATKGRHASIGIAQGNSELTNSVVSTGEWNDALNTIPFITTDGINDAGVVCNINVVPTGDKGRTTGTLPGGESICMPSVVRYILDYADSAKHAVELIKTKVNVWASEDQEKGQECHFMIADNNNTYIVEFVNNEIKVFSDNDTEYDSIPNDEDIMTNFYIDGWNGELITGFDTESGISESDTTLTAHASGVERYKILHDGYNLSGTPGGMFNLMRSVWYTKAYDSEMSPFWYSEYVGDHTGIGFGDLTIYQPSTDFADIVSASINLFNNRIRNGQTWHTMHTSVYNIREKTLVVCSQESEEEKYGFGLFELGEKIQEDISAKDVSYDEYTSYPAGTVGYSINEAMSRIDNLSGQHVEDIADINESISGINSAIEDISNYSSELSDKIDEMEDTYDDRLFALEYTYYDYIIDADSWNEIEEDAYPYGYYATINSGSQISAGTEVELINDSPVLFANYGFAISDIDDQNIVVFSLDIPDDEVKLTIRCRG